MSVDRLLEDLRQSGLVEPAVVETLRRRVSAQSEDVGPEQVIQALVEREKITAWQGRQLLAQRKALHLGKYLLLDVIGAGGMGVVFKARHTVMDRIVAVKVLARRLVSNAVSVARFEKEVKVAGTLHHRNIVTAFDAGSAGETHFLVMEYVPGRDLNYWLRKVGPLPVEVASEFAMQAAQGLKHAAVKGLMHRDVKPSNMLIAWDEEQNFPVLKLLDLGLAVALSEPNVGTQAVVVGTAEYIAPEASNDPRSADLRSDLFSLGCTLFKLLTGRTPWLGNTPLEKLTAKQQSDAPALRSLRPDVSAELEAVVARLLARDPADRCQSPDEVIAALAPFSASQRGLKAGALVFKPGKEDLDNALTRRLSEAELAEVLEDCSTSPEGESPKAAAPTVAAPAEAGKSPTGFGLKLPDMGVRPKDAAKANPLDEDVLLPIESEKQSAGPPKRVANILEELPAAEATPAAPADPAPVRVRAIPVEAKAVEAKPIAKRVEAKRVEAIPVEDKPTVEAKPAPLPAKAAPTRAVPVQAAAAAPVPRSPAQQARSVSAKAAASPLDAIPEADPLATAAKSSRAAPRMSLAQRRRAWDSPLILVGGGALLLMLILAAALVWSLNRRSADEVFAAALEEYNARNYQSASNRFADFAEAFPDHPQTSQARVYHTLAELRIQIETTTAAGQWEEAYNAARTSLASIDKEPAFTSVRGELTTLLPELVEKMVASVRRKPSAADIVSARGVLALAREERYIPGSVRPTEKLDRFEITLAEFEQDLNRDEVRKLAAANITSALEAGDVSRALALRNESLRTDRAFRSQPTMLAVVEKIAEAAKPRAVIDATEQPAVVDDEARLSAVTMPYTPQGRAVPELRGRVAHVVVAGAVYGLDLETGKPLWRRFLGYDSTAEPQSVLTSQENDVVVWDSQRNEILRLGGRDGNLRWRQPLSTGPLVGPPVLQGGRVLAALRDGQIVEINLGTGVRIRTYTVPQPIAAPPVVDAERNRMYVVADELLAYVFTGTECTATIALAHERDTVHVAPLAFDRTLVLAHDHSDPRMSALAMFEEAEDGTWAAKGADRKLMGRVQRPLAHEGRLLGAATSNGSVHLFDLVQPQPLAGGVHAQDTSLSEFSPPMLLRGETVWWGNNSIDRHPAARLNNTPVNTLPIRPFGKRIGIATSLVPVDEHLLSVERPQRGAGTRIVLRTADTLDELWSTQLGVPIVAGPWKEGSVYKTLSSLGDAATIPASNPPAFAPTIHAVDLLDDQQWLTAVPLDDGGFLAGRRGDPKALRHLPGSAGNPFSIYQSAEPAGGPPLAVTVGVLLTHANGGELFKPNVAYVNHLAGGIDRSKQPKLFGPAQIGVNEYVQIAVGDRLSTLDRWRLVVEPEPALGHVGSQNVERTIATAPAVAGQRIYAADEQGTLLLFDRQTLEPVGEQPLGGPVEWGPVSVGDVAFLQVGGKLQGWSGTGERLFERHLPGPIVPDSTPLADNSRLWFALRNGIALAIDPNSGADAGRIDVGEGFISPLSWIGSRLAVLGSDGSIHHFPRPGGN